MNPVQHTSSLYARVYPGALRAAELACLKHRREKAGSSDYSPTDPEVPAPSAAATTTSLPEDTVGIAISGGGIRSATFALGVLQAIAARRLLRRVDFLSTVSGGGTSGFLGALVQRQEPIQANGPTGIDRAERDLPNPSSEPVRWLRDHGRYMSPNGAGDEIIAAAVYLRNLGAIHVVLGITTVTILSAAMLLRTWAISEWPEYIPQWSGWWFWLSPYILLPAALLGVIAVPFGWAYWFIQRDKNRQLSDWVAAPTALLVTITAFAVLKQGEPHNLYVLWSLRLLVVIPMFALLAWAAAWFRATQQVGADVEVFTRSKLSQWLAASLVAVAGLVAFAVVDSFGLALYDWLRSNPLHWSRVSGLMGVVAGLITAVSKLAPFLGDKRGERHVSLPKNVIAGAGAVVVIGWILVSLSALTYAAAWRGACPDHGLPNAMDKRTLLWLTIGAGVLTLLCGRTIRFVNSSSHQALYGNRLTRAYLGASNRNRFIDSSGRRLSDPIRGDNIGWGEYGPFRSGGPLHIVNVTLNETVLGASQVEQRDRKGMLVAVGPCGMSGGIESHALWKQLVDGDATRSNWTGRLPGLSTD